MGQSAGGVSVALHMLSPMSKGLFQRAIIQSAGPFPIWGFLSPEASQKRSGQGQCCQMVYFQAKNANLGKFFGPCGRKMLVNFINMSSILPPFGIFCGNLVYFMALWYSLWQFGIFYGNLVYFMVIWYIFPLLVCCIKVNLATLIPASKSIHLLHFNVFPKIN
jgi:hypothetical protein